MADRLGDRLGGRGDRSNGFDTIRLIAASAVIFSHGFVLTAGSEAFEPVHRVTGGQSTIGLSAVAVFFIVSGLLISMSFDRLGDLAAFARNRALRLLPALGICTALTVFVFGPVVTALPLERYFVGSETWRYLGNAVLMTSYNLPGVFAENPLPRSVNGSLWTLRFEVACYVGGTMLLAFGRWRTPLVWLAWGIAMLAVAILPPAEQVGGAGFFILRTLDLFRFYGAGMLLYLNRDRIVLSSLWGTAAALAVGTGLFTPFFDELLATCGAYAVMVLAFRAAPWFKRLTEKGDISYGVYIYAFPMQQLFAPYATQFPVPWIANVAMAIPPTFALALLSWLWVEKPAMALKNRWRKPSAQAA